METVSIITTRSQPVRYFLNPLVLLRTLWRHRDLIRQLTWRNVLGRYRGSTLGVLWSFVLPLLMLAVYTFVFSVVFQARWPHATGHSTVGFALTLYCGLIVYSLLSETLGQAPGLIVQNVSYVKKVVFPLEILPLCVLGAALLHALIGVVVLLACAAVFGGVFSATVVYFPLILVPLLLLTLGLAWFLASLGVYLRDTGQVVSVLLLVLMFLTPVFYSVEQVPAGSRQIMLLNPLTTIVENARNTLLWGRPPDWPTLGLVTALALVAMQLGYVWFMKTRRGFADVI